MARALIGLLIAPLAYALTVGPAIDFSFGLVSHGVGSWRWGGVDLFGVGFAYLVTLTLFLPFVLLCRWFYRNALWLYLIAGFFLGFVGPFYLLSLYYYITGYGVGDMLQGGPWLVVPQAWHYQAGSAIAACILLTVFWFIAVYRNSWFAKQPNNRFETDAQNRRAAQP